MVTNEDPSRVRIVRAYRRGQTARRAGRPLRSIPYDVNGSLADRFYARAWLRGYNTADEPPQSA